MSTPGRNQSHTGDPYAVLGVPRGASRREIAAAYRRLVKRHHPDVDPDPSAAARMQRINAAWRSLSGRQAPERHAVRQTPYAERTSPGTRPRRARSVRARAWATWDSRASSGRSFDPRPGSSGWPIPNLEPHSPRPMTTDIRFQDTGWAALLAAGVMLVVLFAAAYAGALSSSSQIA
jgi:hypothetical protein